MNNLKRILLILLAIFVFGFYLVGIYSITRITESESIEIRQYNNTYYTNKYTTDSIGCITFISKQGSEIKICGNYVIKNRQFKKE